MKHTPGPWTAVLDSGIDHLIVTNGVTIASTSYETHNGDIFQKPVISKQTAKDNANLLAAAPEMLEVLEGIEKWQNGEDNEFHTTALELLKRLRGK